MTSAVDAGCLLRWRWLGRGRCEVLIEGGAVSHACCCRWGKTPIHKASGENHFSCVEILVAGGANINDKDKSVLLMSVATLLLALAMLLMASIEIANAVAFCVCLRVDGKCC
jgi:hypothetical protein